MATVLEKPHIESRPGVCGGKPCIIGTGISVLCLYSWHLFQRMTAEEIAGLYPQISLADVYAALTYAYDHLDEMHAALKAEDELVEQLRKKYGPGPLELKLRSMPTTDSSAPS